MRETSYSTQITKDYVCTCPHSISFQAQIQQLGETLGRTCEKSGAHKITDS